MSGFDALCRNRKALLINVDQTFEIDESDPPDRQAPECMFDSRLERLQRVGASEYPACSKGGATSTVGR
jgi:hypothetical protein